MLEKLMQKKSELEKSMNERSDNLAILKQKKESISSQIKTTEESMLQIVGAMMIINEVISEEEKLIKKEEEKLIKKEEK